MQKSSLQNVYVVITNQFDRYDISISQMSKGRLPFIFITNKPFTRHDYMSNMPVFYKKQELLTHREHIDSSPFMWGPCFSSYQFSVLFCLSLLCILFLTLTASLDSSFLIAPSIFSNVYSKFHFIFNKDFHSLTNQTYGFATEVTVFPFCEKYRIDRNYHKMFVNVLYGNVLFVLFLREIY